MTKKKKNILISAYSFAPKEGSEPNLGYNLGTRISKYYNVSILTAYHYKKRCDAHKDLISNDLDIHFIKVPILWKIYENQGIFFKTIYYYLWQFFALSFARKLHKKRNFILAHHITFAKFSIPSFMWKLKIPLIFGVCGGGERTPKLLYKNLSIKHKIIESIRILSIKMTTFDFFLKNMYKNTAFCFASTHETAEIMQSLGAKNVKIMTQVALNEDDLNFQKKKKKFIIPSDIKLDLKSNFFMACGRPLYWKGFDLVIESFANLISNNKDNDTLLVMCTFGGDNSHLKKIAKSLNIFDKIIFIDKLSREYIFHLFSKSIALIHPSLHDSGSFVIAEAQSIGLPVICLDCGGPSIILNDKAGFKIPLKNKADVIYLIADKMNILLDDIKHDSKLKNNFSTIGQNHANTYLSWEYKIKSYKKIYEQIIDK